MKKARVFVVEDHASTARGLKMYLETMGYSVQTARTFQAACELAHEIDFDVLVCDLKLADGTGWDLIERLNAKGPVRAIAYSAYDQPAHLKRSKRAGFFRHIIKGAPPESLIEAIEDALKQDVARIGVPA